MNHKLAILTIICFLAIFLVSCTSISEDQAKNSALIFVQTNVVFQSQNKSIQNPYMQIVNSRKDDGNFIFDIIATTTGEEKIKSAKFNVVVNKEGKVVMFNNKSVALATQPSLGSSASSFPDK